MGNNVSRTCSSIVGVKFDLTVSGMLEHVHEDFHHQDEKSGGERTALLDARVEVDAASGTTLERSVAVGFVKERLDGIDVSRVQANFVEKGEHRLVGDRVKGFLEIYKKNVVDSSVTLSTIELFIEESDVVFNGKVRIFAKTGLVVRDNSVDGRSDAVIDDGGDNSVVSVIDNQWAGVSNKTSVGFGENKKKPSIEVTRDFVTTGHGNQTAVEDGGGNINQLGKGSKRNTVWARARVLLFEGRENGIFDQFESKGEGSPLDLPSKSTKKRGRVGDRFAVPLVFPEIMDDVSDRSAVIGRDKGRRVIRRSPLLILARARNVERGDAVSEVRERLGNSSNFGDWSLGVLVKGGKGKLSVDPVDEGVILGATDKVMVLGVLSVKMRRGKFISIM